jgi:5,6-dimethylbenzimidazole synthase
MFTNEEQAAVYKAIYNRRDIRSFLPKPISKDILRRM